MHTHFTLENEFVPFILMSVKYARTVALFDPRVPLLYSIDTTDAVPIAFPLWT
jgi:hypothetical protein